MKNFNVSTISLVIVFFISTVCFAGKPSGNFGSKPTSAIKVSPCLAKHYALQDYVGGLEFITEYLEKYDEAGTYQGIGNSKSEWQSPSFVTFTTDFGLKIEDGYFSTDQTYVDAVDSYNKTVKFEEIIKKHFGKKSIVNCEIKHFNTSNSNGVNPGFIFSCSTTLMCK